MNTHRYRNEAARRCAAFRWWGLALLALFGVVQTARGALPPLLWR